MTHITQDIIPHIEAIIQTGTDAKKRALFSGKEYQYENHTIARVSETNPLKKASERKQETTHIAPEEPATFRITEQSTQICFFVRLIPKEKNSDELRAAANSLDPIIPDSMTLVKPNGENSNTYSCCPALSPYKNPREDKFIDFAKILLEKTIEGSLPFLDIKPLNLAIDDNDRIVITDLCGFSDDIYKTTPEIGLHKHDRPKYTNNQQTYFVHQVMALQKLQQKSQPACRASYPSDEICDALIDLATNAQQNDREYDPFTDVRSQLTALQTNRHQQRETIRTFWQELLRQYPTRDQQEFSQAISSKQTKIPSRRNYWDMFMALPRAFAATMLAAFSQLTLQKNKSKPEVAQPWDTNSLDLQNGLCNIISNKIAQVANYPKNASMMASEVKKNQLTEIEKALTALDAALATSTTDRELSLIITNITKLQEQLSALMKPLRRNSKLHQASELSPIIKKLGSTLREYRWKRANLDLTNSLTKATAEGIIKLITNNPSEFGSETKRTKALKLTRGLLINLDKTLQEKVQDAKTIIKNATQVARQLKSVCYHRYVSILFGRPRLQNDQEIKDQISDYQALAKRYRALSILEKATEKIKPYSNQEDIKLFCQQAKLVAKYIDTETDLELIKQFDQLTYQAARHPKKITTEQHMALIDLSKLILKEKFTKAAGDQTSPFKRRNSAAAFQASDETAKDLNAWEAIANKKDDLAKTAKGSEFESVSLDDDQRPAATA